MRFIGKLNFYLKNFNNNKQRKIMKKVLVTGVSGYLGHQCAVELLKNGYLVKGSLRDFNKKDEVLNGIKKEIYPSEKFDFVKLDLLSDDGWDDAA